MTDTTLPEAYVALVTQAQLEQLQAEAMQAIGGFVMHDGQTFTVFRPDGKLLGMAFDVEAVRELLKPAPIKLPPISDEHRAKLAQNDAQPEPYIKQDPPPPGAITASMAAEHMRKGETGEQYAQRIRIERERSTPLVVELQYTGTRYRNTRIGD